MSLRNVAVAIALLMAFFAGGGYLPAEARSIPWDCSDWQAFAHEDRTIAILESLAENRGKTLYCGVDQSDTFTKAETWEAGKDRNERDDTIYSGERGIFRGFIAAQEGWLTEGESGVTGVSIDRIFEFPREERRRVKRVKRFQIGTDAVQFPTTAVASCDEVLGLICPNWGSFRGGWDGPSTFGEAQARARNRSGNLGGYAHRRLDWRTNIVSSINQHGVVQNANYRIGTPNTDGWLTLAATKADQACRDRGARYVAGSADFGQGHGNNAGSGTARYSGAHLGWFIDSKPGPSSSRDFRARQSRTWSATCKKVIRRTRK